MRTAGSRFGPYEIVALLGQGAMGEVYRSRDTRLMRDVALKVLPEALTHHRTALERFEREARSASALNHPNVVTVYEVGQIDGTAYLAMELIEGRTLRDILREGALSVRRAVDIAAQVADALAAAHARGIVHRDLKPENLIVSPEGRVKVLDFGLAKLVTSLSGELPVAHDLDAAPTSPGTVLGTVGYMSPEQARGQPVDFRSDQFSFAAVFYEMITGRPPFRRPTLAETLTAIIRDDAEPFPTIDPRLDTSVRWIIDRCMAKEPDARYGSTRDMAHDVSRLRDISFHSGASTPSFPAVLLSPRALRRFRRGVVAAVLLGGVGLAGVVAGLWMSRGASPRFERITFRRGTVWSARFGSDGRSIVYSAAWEGEPFRVFQKHPENAASVSLALPPAEILAVSPSGELAVLVDVRVIPPGRTTGTLALAPFTGGTPRRIRDDVQYADWDRQGRELLVIRASGGKTLLEYPIGRTLYETSGWLSQVRVSPDGGRAACLEHAAAIDTRGHVVLIDLKSGRAEILGPEWSTVDGLAWSPSGKEIWISAAGPREIRSVYAVALGGRARLVQMGPGRLSLLDIAPTGEVLLARESRWFGIACSDGTGPERDVTHLDSSMLADLCSDGRCVLFTEFGEGVGDAYEVYMRGTDGSPPEKLGAGFGKALSPNGRSALAVLPLPPQQLLLLDTAAGQPVDISRGGMVYYASANFLPDGKGVVFVGGKASEREARLYVQDLSGGEPRAISPPGIRLSHMQGLPVSPDSRYVAALGPDERIALYPTDGAPARVVPGLDVGMAPIGWSPDSQALFVYRGNELPARIQRIDPVTGRGRLWRELRPADPAGVHGFPVIRLTRDGKGYAYSYARFLQELYLTRELK
jgi:tRNA A-37 threonylcarbamoyl transferase component Bud32